MQNIEIDKLDALKGDAEKLYQVYANADHWVNANLKFEIKDQLSLQLKHGRRIINKIVRSINSKPVFALYGASQVGKSYLIKNLLSVEGLPLKIDFDGNKYDFLKDINPAGVGAESTGVVTRFTIDKHYSDGHHPVRVKLLQPKDLIIILCDSFFTDVKKISNYPAINAFVDLANQLDKKYGTTEKVQSVLNEDDIFDIQDYFTANFSKHSYYTDRINESAFWFKLGRIINRIPLFHWTNTFEILWNSNEEISKLFSKLVSELAKIDFESEVFASADAILRGKGEILDVQTLRKMYDDDSCTAICSRDGSKYDMSISVLSALSAELTLSVDASIKEQKRFLQNTDLLDFPGARSRLELSIETLNTEVMPEMFLRGKVAYLFNKYSSDYEISNLLFCQNDKQSEVKEIPTLLNDWISNNIGRNKIEREGNTKNLPISPLFVIFTFFNNQLKYDNTNDDKDSIDYKWDTRFNRFFEEELVTKSYDWHINWAEKQANFSNFFLLRDFKYSEDTFTGFESNGVESGIQPNRVNFLDKMKRSFVEHPFVIRHFPNPEVSWDMVALPNRDGSEMIINKLEPVANNFIKTNNYTHQLKEFKSFLTLQLSRYYQSDDLDEKRKSAMIKGNHLQLELNRVFGRQPELFGIYVKHLLIDEALVYNYFHDNLIPSRAAESFDEYTLFRSQFPDLNSDNTLERNMEILRENLGFESIDQAKHFLHEEQIDLAKVFSKTTVSSADVLVDGLFDLWQSQLVYESFQDLIAAGMSKSAFNDLSHIIIATMENLQLRNILLKLVEEKYHGFEISRESEEYLAALCANYINDFISNVGFNFMQNDMIAELAAVTPVLAKEILKLNSDNSISSKSELEKLFLENDMDNASAIAMTLNPMITSYNNFLLKLKMAVLCNCGFVNYDVRANARLKELIGSVEELSFNME